MALHIKILASMLCAFLLTGCQFFKQEGNRLPEEMHNRAVFVYLEDTSLLFRKQLVGKIRVDPALRSRETFELNDKVYFSQPMHSDLLRDPLPKHEYRISIPDGLRDRYTYIDPNDTDYMHDYAIIYHFSPLLPTTTPDVYLMEEYCWASSCDTVDCYRMFTRMYLKFKVKNTKVEFLGLSLIPEEKGNMLGFGGYPRAWLNQAKSGEKIRKRFR